MNKKIKPTLTSIVPNINKNYIQLWIQNLLKEVSLCQAKTHHYCYDPGGTSDEYKINLKSSANFKMIIEIGIDQLPGH